MSSRYAPKEIYDFGILVDESGTAPDNHLDQIRNDLVVG